MAAQAMSDEGPDPRFQPDAYIRIGRHLYEIVEVDGDEVRVRNCRTLHDLYLTRHEVERAELVDPGPVMVPAEWA